MLILFNSRAAVIPSEARNLLFGRITSRFLGPEKRWPSELRRITDDDTERRFNSITR